MSIFRLACFFLTLILAICTLAVGLILSPYWKENKEAPKQAKIHLSLSIISILLLGASGLLTLVSIISGPGRTKRMIIISIILLVITVGFLCASIVYMFTQVNHSFAYWIFASLWISVTCIPFALCTIYIQPIQMERL
ncbi:hypothetical protein MN116_007769 [Schistosoma mekongi]|uniref:CAI-2 protein n=1 Tax=Schistosoma mekongi TaxID=38744 RepID=A0AAE1Z6R4_SCHME|nr:hypothetical protein MN116_007769 [Schistosoma mekongi]